MAKKVKFDKELEKMVEQYLADAGEKMMAKWQKKVAKAEKQIAEAQKEWAASEKKIKAAAAATEQYTNRRYNIFYAEDVKQFMDLIRQGEEMVKKFEAAKTVEEKYAIAKENGVDCTLEEFKKALSALEEVGKEYEKAEKEYEKAAAEMEKEYKKAVSQAEKEYAQAEKEYEKAAGEIEKAYNKAVCEADKEDEAAESLIDVVTEAILSDEEE